MYKYYFAASVVCGWTNFFPSVVIGGDSSGDGAAEWVLQGPGGGAGLPVPLPLDDHRIQPMLFHLHRQDGSH